MNRRRGLLGVDPAARPVSNRTDTGRRIPALDLPGPRLVLESDAADDLPSRLAGLGIAGGATYDALIALTARHAGAELVTLDKRAHDTYRRRGTATRLIGPALTRPREEA
ncbi:hypothetical protein GCM10023321_35310 [Pseudonocardia eucalypti]|uniref:PIN domain-containing protein n=1 Tax=Pseudonocardia eucalypti TaxID=648755 RepID=A0ABP9Q5R7_9PSEU